MESGTVVVIVFVIILLIVALVFILNIMGYGQPGYVQTRYPHSMYMSQRPRYAPQPMYAPSGPKQPPLVRLAQAFTGQGLPQ